MPPGDLLFQAGLELVRLAQLLKWKAETASDEDLAALWWEEAARIRILGLVCIEASDPTPEEVFGQ